MEKSACLTSKAVKISVTMTTGYWQRHSGFGEEGDGRSWLGVSPEFWKMPFLPSGLLAVKKSAWPPMVTGRESEERGKTAG